MVFIDYGNSNFEHTHFIGVRHIDEYILICGLNAKNIIFGLFLVK